MGLGESSCPTRCGSARPKYCATADKSMKAYLLRNNELELMWSWEPERQPTSEAPAAAPLEISGNSMPNGTASPGHALPSEPLESSDAPMQDSLGALDGAVRTGREPDVAGPVELHSVQTAPLLPHAETLEDWVQATVTAVGGAVRQQ